MAGVTVPLHSAEHFYVVTEPFDGVHPDLPILRDPDGYTYFKEEVGGLVVGGFEPEAKPWVSPDQIPYPFEFQLLEEDWEHFSVLMESAMPAHPGARRRPASGSSTTAPRASPRTTSSSSARHPRCGTSSSAPASTPSASRRPAVPVGRWPSGSSRASRRRTSPPSTSAGSRAFNGNNQWLHDRVAEVLGLHYEIPWPNREMRTARPFRRSPLYRVLEQANANFGSKMGWERANFFAPAGRRPRRSSTPGRSRTGCRGSPPSTRNTRTGRHRLRPDVVLEVPSSWAPMPSGRSSGCAPRTSPCRPGAPSTPGMLNARGTYESDVTVTRVGHDEYLLVSSAATTERDQDHIRRNLPPDSSATVVDVTSSLRRARRDGAAVPRAPVAADRCGPVERGVPLRHRAGRSTSGTRPSAPPGSRTSASSAGSCTCPPSSRSACYEELMSAGADLGVANGGYYAIDSMRLEKGYRAFGRELTPDYTPVDAGLLFACKLRTDIPLPRPRGRRAGASGRAASQARLLRRRTTRSRCCGAASWCCATASPPARSPPRRGARPWARASASPTCGTRTGGPIDADWVRAASYEVAVGSDVHAISVSLRPLVDPEGLRTKA